MTRSLALAALALSLATGAAGAQAVSATPAAGGAMTAATAGAPKGAKPRTAQSIECSKKADSANVHGKPRQAFMRKCKAGKA